MTRLAVDLRETAQDDIVERYVWLAREAGLDVADRMTASVDQTIWRLADAPGIGTPVAVIRTDLRGLRKAKVAGFANLLVFYLADEERLQVLRVLHAAQDWLAYLENE